MSAIGDSLARTSQEIVFDPQSGEQWQETWDGTQAAILALYNAFVLAGARVRTSNRGPLWSLVALFGKNTEGTPETVYDTYNIETEFAQVDLRSSDDLLQAAGTTAELAKWIRDIDAAIAAGQTLPAYLLEQNPGGVTILDSEQGLYDYKARGGQGYEVRRPILTRTRTFSASYAGASVVPAKESIYTTAKLISVFNLPATIASRLPGAVASNPLPTFVPTGTAWSWRVRKDSSRFVPALNRVEETMDWVFAAWSTLFYTLVQ